MNKKNIYSYTKTELNKMKKLELLKLYYEQKSDYFENVNGSIKNWSKNNPFSSWSKANNNLTRADLKYLIVTA